MAKKTVSHQESTADPIVMAIGASGKPEPCRLSETVAIDVIPMDEENRIIPATIRALARYAGECTPQRLLKIERPNKRKGRPYVSVRWECKPFVRYTMGKKSVYGTEASCYVRDMRDALDPLFGSLSERERAKIHSAVARHAGAVA